jgi:multiple sugar transport system permease protein
VPRGTHADARDRIGIPLRRDVEHMMFAMGPYRHGVRLRTAPVARGVVLVAFAVFFVAPLAWLVLAPTKTDSELLTRNPLAFGNLRNVWDAWQQVDGFSSHIFRRWMANSLLYSLSATAITLVTAIPAGYGLVVGRFPGRKLILSLTLVALIMPPAALVLPIFLELNALRLIGSSLSIILPFAFFPFGVYLAYIYYATALPPALLDAARVDGCGEWATFRHVGIPLAKPSIALVFFFSFVANWNDFFLPYVFLSDERRQPIQVGLSDLFRSSRPAVALATLVAAMPVAVVFVVSQRALLRGLVGGSAKG